MIFFSLVLVVVAAVALVLGVFQDGRVLVFVSIGSCLGAMAALGAAALLRRRDEITATPAAYAGPARTPLAPVRRPAVGPAASVERDERRDEERADERDDGPDVRALPEPARTATASVAQRAVAHVARSEADLAAVRGLGPAKRGALLARFGSVDAVAAASVEELTATPGIGVGLARAIRDQLG